MKVLSEVAWERGARRLYFRDHQTEILRYGPGAKKQGQEVPRFNLNESSARQRGGQPQLGRGFPEARLWDARYAVAATPRKHTPGMASAQLPEG